MLSRRETIGQGYRNGKATHIGEKIEGCTKGNTNGMVRCGSKKQKQYKRVITGTKVGKAKGARGKIKGCLILSEK